MTIGLLPPALALLIAVSALLLFAYARRGKASFAVQFVFAVFAANYAVFAWSYGNATPLNGLAILLFGGLEGPAIWWLVRTKSSDHTGRPHWKHLGGAAALLIAAAVTPYTNWGWIYAVMSAIRLIYVLAALSLILTHHRAGKNGAWLAWASLLAMATAGLSLLKVTAFSVYVLDNSWHAPLWLIIMKSIGISIVTLTLLWWALVKPEVFLGRQPRPPKRDATADDRQLYDVFAAFMEKEQAYLQEDLKISDVADALAALPREVSEAINRSSGNSFKGEIRRYRIQHACNLLVAEPGASVIDIAHRSGFATKSVFNTAFKTETGTSPSAYRKGKIAPPAQ
ncbi:MAG: AraC family transcriptional regulator [Alphaproteobacteria bacterium]|nr:AraC family transcriptional regulator [Alphaproteobacteria bacterium]